MNRIIRKKQLSEKVYLFEIEAPLIAKARKAGNFVIVRVDSHGERMPLTIADADTGRGTITLVVQRVGLSSAKLCRLSEGDTLADVAGPLGTPTRIRNYGTVLCAGGGVGTAPLLPIIRALKAAGNRVLSVIAGRSQDLVILRDEVAQSSDEVMIMTDDGSLGEKGVVTAGMEKFIAREHIDKAFCIGPAVMMKFCCQLTARYGIPTDVSLNTIMVDGTGMCGACRLTIGGETKFVCIDGPEFDGALVDWDEMLKRMGTFRQEEQRDMTRYEQQEKAAAEAIGNTADTPHHDDPADRNAPWREQLRKAMKPKERMATERVVMPELDPEYRVAHRKEEVNQGISPEAAQREASRCLDCAKPSCVEGCPVGIDIPSFIKNIERGDTAAAVQVIKRTSSLPAVCGRVCPQEKQCESRCIHLKTGGKAVAIGYLERFAADSGMTRNAATEEKHGGADNAAGCATPRGNGKKIAVVGSGPSGLTFAGEMAKRGYMVTVFEALHEIGGVLKYGIPEFRLPNAIVDREIDSLRDAGVEFVTNCVIGRTVTVEQLKEQGYEGFFVGSGAGLPRFMNIPGENSLNVMSSNEYLTRVNLMNAADPDYDTPVNRARRVLVVGGGNTAMDSCRTARRLGAEVTVVYRRSEAEMPARQEEVRHAREEGVTFLTLHNPVEYTADGEGRVTGAVLQVMRLGEPDASGRRSPVPVEGKTVRVEADQVIVAVGVSPNPLVPKSIEGLRLGRKNTIEVDEAMQSSRPGIYAGGDIVRGGATVILAMGDGRRAAENMDRRLSGEREQPDNRD